MANYRKQGGIKRVVRSKPHLLSHAPIPRLKRCGATDEELDDARAAWRALTGEQRLETARMMDVLTDAELRAQIVEAR